MSFQNSLYQSSEYFVHSRPLGEKHTGSHFYKNVLWSDVAVQHVSYETTQALKVADDYNDHQRKCAIIKNAFKTSNDTMICERKGGSERYGDDYRSIFGKGRPSKQYKASDYEWRDGRMRKITKIHRKYPTKPKIHAKVHRNKYAKSL